MIHRANADFWNDYSRLPASIRARARKQFALLKADPQHPSLQFKRIGERNGQEVWSARVTIKYRALAVKFSNEYLWFWIGDHGVYDVLISNLVGWISAAADKLDDFNLRAGRNRRVFPVPFTDDRFI